MYEKENKLLLLLLSPWGVWFALWDVGVLGLLALVFCVVKLMGGAWLFG